MKISTMLVLAILFVIGVLMANARAEQASDIKVYVKEPATPEAVVPASYVVGIQDNGNGASTLIAFFCGAEVRITAPTAKFRNSPEEIIKVGDEYFKKYCAKFR